MRGVLPKKAAMGVNIEPLKTKKLKNTIPVIRTIKGVIKALNVQENLRMTFPDIKIAINVAIIPIQVMTCPM